MPARDRLVYVQPFQAQHALSDEENTSIGPHVCEDTEGTHTGYPATLTLGFGWIGKTGIPFNLCSSSGRTVGTGQKRGTYGHG